MKEKAIGVFDSGLGGLAVAKKVLDEMPEEDIVYFADFAHLPYGPRPREEVRSFVLQIVDFFVRKGVKAILIGCNTASAVAAEAAQERASDIPVIGMIKPAVKAALQYDNIRKVGIIGTIGTIESKAYQEAFGQLFPSVEVLGHACPELLRLAEQGRIYDKSNIQILAKDCVSPLESQGIDALVLGCTDFTCISTELQAVVNHEIQIVDPAKEVVRTAARILEENHWRRAKDKRGNISFFSSGKAPQGASKFAQRIFNICLDGFSMVRFEAL
jgi:glutamate racemase